MNEQEYFEKLEKAKKQFWARLFSVTKDKEQAFKVADNILKKLKLWSWSSATIEDFDRAYGMTNSINGCTVNTGKIDTGTEYGDIIDEPINYSSYIL